MSHWGAVEGSYLPFFHGSSQLAQIPDIGASSAHTWKQHSLSLLLCNALAACSPVSGMFGSEIIAFSNDLMHGQSNADDRRFSIDRKKFVGKRKDREQRVFRRKRTKLGELYSFLDTFFQGKRVYGMHRKIKRS